MSGTLQRSASRERRAVARLPDRGHQERTPSQVCNRDPKPKIAGSSLSNRLHSRDDRRRFFPHGEGQEMEGGGKGALDEQPLGGREGGRRRVGIFETGGTSFGRRTKGEKQEEGEEGHSKGEGKEAREKTGALLLPYHWEEGRPGPGSGPGAKWLRSQPQAPEKDDEKGKKNREAPEEKEGIQLEQQWDPVRNFPHQQFNRGDGGGRHLWAAAHGKTGEHPVPRRAHCHLFGGSARAAPDNTRSDLGAGPAGASTVVPAVFQGAPPTKDATCDAAGSHSCQLLFGFGVDGPNPATPRCAEPAPQGPGRAGVGEALERHCSVRAGAKEQGSVASQQETEQAAREAIKAGRVKNQAGRPYGATAAVDRGEDWRPDAYKGKSNKGQGKGKDWRQKGEGKPFPKGKEGEQERDKNRAK